VLLVRISDVADAALQLHAAALLHHVRGLVSHGVQIRALAEHDVIARGVRAGTHRLRTRRGFGPRVRPDLRDVVSAECALQPVGERQAARRRRPRMRCSVPPHRG